MSITTCTIFHIDFKRLPISSTLELQKYFVDQTLQPPLHRHSGELIMSEFSFLIIPLRISFKFV